MKPPRKWLKRSIVLSAALIIVVVALAAWWASRSNSGTIQNSNPQSVTSAKVSYKTLSDRYISFQYNAIYTVKPLVAKDPDLDLYNLTADTGYPKELAVAVQRGSVDLTSGYILRKSLPNQYHSSNITVDGQATSLWFKDDGSEETAFIAGPHDTVAILSFSTENGAVSSDLSAEVTRLLASFNWQQ